LNAVFPVVLIQIETAEWAEVFAGRKLLPQFLQNLAFGCSMLVCVVSAAILYVGCFAAFTSCGGGGAA